MSYYFYMVKQMKKTVLTLVLSELIIVIYGNLLNEKIVVLFALALPIYVLVLLCFVKYSNNVNNKNNERNRMATKCFLDTTALLSIVIAICAVLDFHFGISHYNDDYITVMVLIPSIVILINFFIRISHLPPRKI